VTGRQRVSHIEERRIGDLTVRIDRTLCVAFELCIDLAPDVFRFDDEGIATFTGTEADVSRDLLIEACRACPVDALVVIDGEGSEIVP
jgi:ferredoxin